MCLDENTDSGSVKDAVIKYLFTTKTCPNCAVAKEMLSNENIVLVDAEDNRELARKYVGEEGSDKYINASNIQKYVDQQN